MTVLRWIRNPVEGEKTNPGVSGADGYYGSQLDPGGGTAQHLDEHRRGIGGQQVMRAEQNHAGRPPAQARGCG